MKVFWKQSYLKYIIVVIILLLILYFLYYHKTLEGATSQTYGKTEKCGEFTTANKKLTHDLTNITLNTSQSTITQKIKTCMNLINNINSYLPMNINDVIINPIEQIPQSKSANKNPYININVTPPPQNLLGTLNFANSTDSTGTGTSEARGPSGAPSPASSKSNPTFTNDEVTSINLPISGAKWTLDIVLPTGMQGPTGEQGDAGINGTDGLPGLMGSTGQRGPPGRVPGSVMTNE